MELREALLRELSDGELHSGTELARRHGVSRSAVWKQLRGLAAFGVAVEAVRGGGYRLSAPLELLDASAIRAALPGPVATRLRSLGVQPVTDSTSDRLRALPAPPPGSSDALLADFQTGGRGRRGRRWFSPLGSGVTLSVNWAFDAAPPDLPAVGLAMGVAARDALAGCGAVGLGVKWPNDLVSDAGKVAGLLLDLDGEAQGPLRLVVGIGVNLTVPANLADAVAGPGVLPPAGLATLCPAPPSRNAVAAALVGGLLVALAEFSRAGFAPFADRWRRHDVLHGRAVEVAVGPRRIRGTAAGIAADGSLMLDTGGRLEALVSGEVTVRAAS